MTITHNGSQPDRVRFLASSPYGLGLRHRAMISDTLPLVRFSTTFPTKEDQTITNLPLWKWVVEKRTDSNVWE